MMTIVIASISIRKIGNTDSGTGAGTAPAGSNVQSTQRAGLHL